MGGNHWVTIVATQVVVGSKHKTHRAAMRKAIKGLWLYRESDETNSPTATLSRVVSVGVVYRFHVQDNSSLILK